MNHSKMRITGIYTGWFGVANWFLLLLLFVKHSAPVAFQLTYPPSTLQTEDIFFSDSSYGWVLSNDNGQPTLFRTEDGGDTWIRKPLEANFYRVFFLNEKVGWSIAVNSLNGSAVLLSLYGTHDGGKTWSYLSALNNIAGGPQADMIENFRFVDRQHGWFVGHRPGGVGLAVQTSDGGKSFREVAGVSGRESLSSISAAGKDKLWIFGDNLIIASFDGGRTWTPQLDDIHPLDDRSVRLASGLALTGGHGWAVGAPPLIIRTDDFGKHWRIALERNDDWFTSVSFWDNEHGCAVGASIRMDCTNNGGKTWTSLSVLPSKEVHGHDIYRKILFSSANRCWAISEGGWLFRSDDGGHSWREASLSSESARIPSKSSH